MPHNNLDIRTNIRDSQLCSLPLSVSLNVAHIFVLLFERENTNSPGTKRGVGFFHGANAKYARAVLANAASREIPSRLDESPFCRAHNVYPRESLEISSFHRECRPPGTAKSGRKLRLICVAGT